MASFHSNERITPSNLGIKHLSENFGAINAANLRRAHAAIEGGRTIGKVMP